MGDPYFNNTVLLLHCNGANNSTTFTDDSSKAHTVTPTGNAKISTGVSKFGGASAAFDGSGDYLTTDTSADFTFGTGDFTIEGWVYFNNVTSLQFIMDMRPGVGLYPALWFDYGVSGKIVYFVNGSRVITGTTTPSATTWYHYAISRVSGSTRLYINGTQEGSTWSDTSNYIGNVMRFSAPYDGTASLYLDGNQDCIRVTRAGRYAADFVAPTAAFPDAQSKVSGNITESTAVTDWIITANKCADGSLVGSTTSSGSTYNCEVTTNCPVNVTLSPKIDYQWEASKVVALNDYCVPSNPDTTPRLYQATAIGSVPHKTHSTTEPTWPTSGTVADNDITWTFVINLDDGLFKTLGTKIPT